MTLGPGRLQATILKRKKRWSSVIPSSWFPFENSTLMTFEIRGYFYAILVRGL